MVWVAEADDVRRMRTLYVVPPFVVRTVYVVK